MIFVDCYFRPNQTPKNVEIIFQKSFYAETNGALGSYHILKSEKKEKKKRKKERKKKHLVPLI
jgi:hypothetical protein